MSSVVPNECIRARSLLTVFCSRPPLTHARAEMPEYGVNRVQVVRNEADFHYLSMIHSLTTWRPPTTYISEAAAEHST